MDITKVRPKRYFTFDIPEEMQEECMGIKNFTLKELTANDEMNSAKRSGQDVMRLPFELAKAAIAEYQAEGGPIPVSVADETIDIFLERMGPQGRNLVMDAYQKVSSPGGGAISTFRAQQPRVTIK